MTEQEIDEILNCVRKYNVGVEKDTGEFPFLTDLEKNDAKHKLREKGLLDEGALEESLRLAKLWKQRAVELEHKNPIIDRKIYNMFDLLLLSTEKFEEALEIIKRR